MIKIERIGNDELVQAIKDNDGYCLCAIEKIPETKCICKEFRELQESGICHCGIYKKIIDNN